MDDGELSDRFEVTQGLRQGCVLSPQLFNIFSAAAIEVVLVRFSEEHTILNDLVYLEEEAGVGAGTPLERARRAVWGMLYADDAGVVSRSQEGLTRMMTIIVEVFVAFGLTVSEKKTETLLKRAPDKQPNKGGSPPPPLVIEAAGQKYAQTAQFRYLGGLVNEDGELTQEINHRSRTAWACIGRFSRELLDLPRAPWRHKVRLLKAEAMEATIRQWRLLFTEATARHPAGRLPKRLMNGKLVGGKDPGKGRPEQNWLVCLKDGFQAFGAYGGQPAYIRR